MTEPQLMEAAGHVLDEIDLLVRVFGAPRMEILTRVLEAGIDSVLSDPEVDEIVKRLHALDARRNGSARPAAAPEPPASLQPPRQPAPPVRADVAPHDQDATQRPLSAQERRSAASFVRETRMARNFSQVQLAEVLGTSGSTISNIERADPATSSAAVRSAVAWAKKVSE